MKNRNLNMLIGCIFAGGVLISGNCLGSGNQQLTKSKLSTSSKAPVDYDQRQVNIRSSIFKMFPGTYLDSMGIVINLLGDSIRNEISKTKIKDSIEYLQSCLNNVSKDSILLVELSKLSLDKNQGTPNYTNVLIAHCKDESNSFIVDSVTMDVFSGSRLLTSAIADSFGIIQLRSIPKGDYDIVFSRRLYTPVSLKRVRFTGDAPMYIDILLRKQNSSFVQLIDKNAWLFFAGGALLFFLLVIILAYFLAKFARRKNTTL